MHRSIKNVKDYSLFLLLLLVCACTNAHCQTKSKPHYLFCLVQFGKDTIFIKQSEKEPGQILQYKLQPAPGMTVMTVTDRDGKVIYQTTLPLIPERGEVYPVCIPISDDNYILLAEGVKEKFKYKRIGQTLLP